MMRTMNLVKSLGIILAFAATLNVSGQLITADPAFPVQTGSVVITFDASLGNQGLMAYTGDVYAHAGVITSESTSPSDWKHAPSWGDNSDKYKLERIATDLYQLEITPSISDYYELNVGEEVEELAFVFRSADNGKVGKTADGGDIFYQVYVEGLNVSLIHPDQRPLIVELGDEIIVEAQAIDADSIILYHDDLVVKKSIESSLLDTLEVVQQGKTWIKVLAKNATDVVADSLYYFVSEETTVLPLPGGLEDGINYLSDTSAALVLYAPGKQSVYLKGDFNDWELDNSYLMNQTPDGKRFWIVLDSLEKGKEYIFQYQVDGGIYISDPYCEKVSDPNDSYISESTYPGLLPYPEGKAVGIASYLQTAQDPFEWTITDFAPPPAEGLVVYELLIRDFIASHNYKTLTDTIQYFKRLGVNAVELMPINEFEGNSSWGYNTSHYFALDKYYGPKEDLQRFIDACHAEGIAVILDVVFNHSFSQSPLVKLYWDGVNSQPSAENPWYNQVPKHEYNVGSDMNHESEASKYHISRVIKYWLEEYHVDGYRFDLSKGMTQTNTLGDAGAMARYDASRVAILKAYADTAWKVNPEAHVILEHFADTDEEKVLTEYGMMVWGNSNYNYSRAAMGWHSEGKSDFSWGSYQTRGFSKPHLVTYMESHDEQRHLFDVKKWGNYNNTDYNIRNNLELSLERAELAASFFFTIPGPKMIWQFGEMGYDYDLHYNDDKLGPKPIRWDFLEEANRLRLFQAYAALTKLKHEQAAFNTTDYSIDVANNLKTIQLRHEEMDVCIIGNFDVYPLSIDPAFTKTGTWYDYFTGESIEVTDVNMPIELDISEHRIYTSVPLETPDLIWAPEAQDVSISGNMNIGEELTGEYTFYDRNGDLEGESTYKWFKGKNEDGSDKMQIMGAMGRTHVIREVDWNHYIFFEVTPVAASGELLTGITQVGMIDLATAVGQSSVSGLDMELYPNPADQGFYISINSAVKSPLSVRLYDLNGSLVFRSEMVMEQAVSGDIYIDASSLEKGVYLVKVQTEGALLVRRLVIL